jgi:hypothetical protein
LTSTTKQQTTTTTASMMKTVIGILTLLISLLPFLALGKSIANEEPPGNHGVVVAEAETIKDDTLVLRRKKARELSEFVCCRLMIFRCCYWSFTVTSSS